MNRILLCKFHDGKTQFTAEGAALVVGVPVEELLTRWDPATGARNLPADLQRRGHRRTRTARDATDENDAGSLLGYWAVMNWPGCRLDFDDKAGQLWAVLD